MGCCPGLACRIKNAGEMAAHRPGVLHVCALFRERFIFPLKLYRKAIVCDVVSPLGGPLAKGLMGRVALMGNVRRKHDAARRQEAVCPEQARSFRHLICVHVPFALGAWAIGVVQNGAGEGMSKAAQHCPDGGIEKETIRGIEEGFFAIPQAIEQRAPGRIVGGRKGQNSVGAEGKYPAGPGYLAGYAQAALPGCIQKRGARFFPGESSAHGSGSLAGTGDGQRGNIPGRILCQTGDQMGGVEVIRVGMRLQKIAQRREVFAKMGRTGRSIRPQIQKKISIDEQAGAPAQILSPKGTGLAANRAAAPKLANTP